MGIPTGGHDEVRSAMTIGRWTSVALVATMAVAAGCSSGTKKEISRAVARNAVAVGMKEEFHARHHSLRGLPTCRSTSVAGSTTKVNVSCTGTTTTGQRATLTGQTSGANEVHGTFTGSLDGAQLFTDTCMGC
jgi:hypothetical protein